MAEVVRVKYLIVGSGANGISPAALLKKRGEHDFRIVTKHSDFGGVWHGNRYPGCITDVPVLVYQLSYAMSYDWSSSHASQAEMASYLRKVAHEHGLYPHTDFETEMIEAEWLGNDARWRVMTDNVTYLASFLILATGYLEQPHRPNLSGIAAFKGRSFHSAEWPDDYTGAGDRVAVLGTSSSGVQIVPELQKIADKVLVFQRSPVHLLPLNREFYTEEQITQRRIDAAQLKAERCAFIEKLDAAFRDAVLGQGSGEQLAGMEALVDAHRANQVTDPELRRKLTPAFTLGCKRPTQTDLYYLSLQQSNVELIAEGATKLGESSVFSASGREFEVDTVVMATGFHYGGDILQKIRRRDGRTVAEHQRGHRRAYKSVSVSGCPNLFLIGGSGANGSVWNGFAPGELVPRYIDRITDYMRRNGILALEVSEEAETRWKQRADDILSVAPTVAGGCSNYCLDETGHDMSTWPGNTAGMQASMETFTASDYLAV